MNPKLALTIGAVAAAIFGVLLTFFPAPMLNGFGLQATNEGTILSRDLGVTLLGISILNWLGRNATGAALRAILVGNLAIQVFEFLVNGYELLVGQLPSTAAGGEIIHIVLGLIFVLALRQAGSTERIAA